MLILKLTFLPWGGSKKSMRAFSHLYNYTSGKMSYKFLYWIIIKNIFIADSIFGGRKGICWLNMAKIPTPTRDLRIYWLNENLPWSPLWDKIISHSKYCFQQNIPFQFLLVNVMVKHFLSSSKMNELQQRCFFCVAVICQNKNSG